MSNDALRQQTRSPRSEVELLEEANRRGYAWEESRRAMYRRNSIAAEEVLMGLTTDPSDPRLGYGVDEEPLDQHAVYLVLSDEERAKGFVRPVVQTYVHARDLGGCGVVTHMGLALSETYARNPSFYGATYCVGCRMHKAVGESGEFYWCDSDGRPLTDDLATERILWKVGT